MSYLLKQFDIDLLRFDMQKDIDGVSAQILSVNEKQKNLLPLDLELSNSGLAKWLKRRTIPGNRAYVQNFLAKLGLNEKDTKGIIDFCKGLSLNDCYWVVEENFNGSFADNNLYDNRFSNVLSHIAFTGYGSFQKSSLRSSPEFTTNGMLAKCWRRVDGKIVLYKSGTEGFANSGNEPYCEYYAYQVAETMEINAVQYGLSKWKGRLCSTCELFTSKEYSFMPIGNIVKEGGNNSNKSIIIHKGSINWQYHNTSIGSPIMYIEAQEDNYIKELTCINFKPFQIQAHTQYQKALFVKVSDEMVEIIKSKEMEKEKINISIKLIDASNKEMTFDALIDSVKFKMD